MKVKGYSMIIAALFVAANAFAHSEGIKPGFVEKLMEHYLSVQQALAIDEIEATTEGANQFGKTLNLNSSLSMKPSIIKIKRSVGKLRKADDLASARIAFQTLSAEMHDLVDDVGIKSKKSLYLVRCPMAFSNKGGYWIQDETEISNPYLGASMQNCGNIEKLTKRK